MKKNKKDRINALRAICDKGLGYRVTKNILSPFEVIVLWHDNTTHSVTKWSDERTFQKALSSRSRYNTASLIDSVKWNKGKRSQR